LIVTRARPLPIRKIRQGPFFHPFVAKLIVAALDRREFSMKWYYAENGKQMGPVEESALDDLVRSGVVRDNTLVWREGMANWQPHQAVRSAAVAPPPPTLPTSPDMRYCAECGRPFPSGELVTVGNASVCAQCKPVYLQRLREGGQAIGARRYAGFWIRFVARLIDGVILSIVVLILRIPFLALIPLAPDRVGPAALPLMMGLGGVMILINLVVGVAYEAYFVSTRGGTPGKLALGLRIIRADGSPVSAGLAAGRYFAQWISGIILLIGYIMAGFDDEKRALHDRICDTRVIHVS
jgi:uncharacterized RDD family membrane protein YckC